MHIFFPFKAKLSLRFYACRQLNRPFIAVGFALISWEKKGVKIGKVEKVIYGKQRKIHYYSFIYIISIWKKGVWNDKTEKPERKKEERKENGRRICLFLNQKILICCMKIWGSPTNEEPPTHDHLSLSWSKRFDNTYTRLAS